MKLDADFFMTINTDDFVTKIAFKKSEDEVNAKRIEYSIREILIDTEHENYPVEKVEDIILHIETEFFHTHTWIHPRLVWPNRKNDKSCYDLKGGETDIGKDDFFENSY